MTDRPKATETHEERAKALQAALGHSHEGCSFKSDDINLILTYFAAVAQEAREKAEEHSRQMERRALDAEHLTNTWMETSEQLRKERDEAREAVKWGQQTLAGVAQERMEAEAKGKLEGLEEGAKLAEADAATNMLDMATEKQRTYHESRGKALAKLIRARARVARLEGK